MAKPTPSETQTQSNEADAIKAQAEKLAAIKREQLAILDAEEKSVTDAFSAYLKSLGAIGPMVRERLAVKVGQSVTKAGRPALSEWSRFVHALLYSNVSFTEQDRLFRLAGANVGKSNDATAKEWTAEEINKARERFVKAKARKAQGQAACSLRMAMPVAVEITLGE